MYLLISFSFELCLFFHFPSIFIFIEKVTQLWELKSTVLSPEIEIKTPPKGYAYIRSIRSRDVVLEGPTIELGEPLGVGKWNGEGEVSLQASWDQGGRGSHHAKRRDSK
jgi:hypothetical protein